MRVLKYNSKTKLVTINTNRYRIDWENDGASKIERQFRDLIYPYWRNCIVLFQPRIPGSLLRLDFLCVNKRICVETDGVQHGEFNKHFHANSRLNYLSSIKRDLNKEKWLEDNKISLIRLDGDDLNNFSPNYILDKFSVSIV